MNFPSKPAQAASFFTVVLRGLTPTGLSAYHCEGVTFFRGRLYLYKDGFLDTLGKSQQYFSKM